MLVSVYLSHPGPSSNTTPGARAACSGAGAACQQRGEGVGAAWGRLEWVRTRRAAAKGQRCGDVAAGEGRRRGGAGAAWGGCGSGVGSAWERDRRATARGRRGEGVEAAWIGRGAAWGRRGERVGAAWDGLRAVCRYRTGW